MMALSKDCRPRRRQNIILKLLAAGLIFLLLLRTGVFRMVLYSVETRRHDSHARHGSKSLLRELAVERLSGELYPMNCSIQHFKRPAIVDNHTPAQCKQLNPTERSCRIARELFQHKSTGDGNDGCAHQERHNFCKLKGNLDKYSVSCDRETCDGQLGLVTVNSETGNLELKHFSKTSELEKDINHMLLNAHMGYCYVMCLYTESPIYELEDGELSYDIQKYGATQILNLPPIFLANNIRRLDSNTGNGGRPININLIFIDSVSRSHFFRSLPRTVKVLDDMLTSAEPYQFHSGGPLVLDFELFQALRSRTYESLQTLFSGYINPFEKTFGIQDMPPKPLNIAKLLKPLQDAGYTTMWLEDLCYLWEWGMSKDLLIFDNNLSQEDTWKKLRSALENANIDSMGISYASCEILRANGVNDPFHGPDNICYNGRHQHEYFLEFLQQFQSHLSHHDQPYFTIMETNLAHEDTGARVQSLDSDLAAYLEFLKDQENTLTFLFSDHGNSYGSYVSKSEEGKIEVFHPFLFMIVPENVQKIIGETNMLSLVQNQQRLVSLLDVHYALASVITSIHSSSIANQTETNNTIYRNISHVARINKHYDASGLGLLGSISKSRTCDTISRIMPNLCICEGYEFIPKINSAYKDIAASAVNELNYEILRQLHGPVSKSRKFGRCQRLKLATVLDLKESRKSDGSKLLKMQVSVRTTTIPETETFFIAIQVPVEETKGRQTDPHRTKARRPRLLRFERISQYGKFRICADHGVNLQLCVCALNSTSTT